MKVVNFGDSKEVEIPEPFNRKINVLFAPDKHNVDELTLSIVKIPPYSKTHFHSHDRPELIIILAGSGISVCGTEELPVKEDMALWVEAGENHAITNDQNETLKLMTIFTPGYSTEELLGPIFKATENK